MINRDVWDRLGPTRQAILTLATRSGIVASIAEGDASQFAVMQDQAENLGVKHMQWSPEMLNVFETAWQEHVSALAKKDAFFAEAWNDFSTFRKGYDRWERHAFLPRKVHETSGE